MMKYNKETNLTLVIFHDFFIEMKIRDTVLDFLITELVLDLNRDSMIIYNYQWK